MALFSNDRDSLDLHDELAALRKEVSALSRSLSKSGASAYRGARDETADLYAEITESLARALPMLRMGARSVEGTIRDNPTRAVALAGLATLGIVAAVMLGSRRR